MPALHRARFAALASLLLLLTLTLNACAGAPPSSENILTVLAAASLTESFDRLKADFENANPGVTVTISYAGSQQLAQQLIQGAPADVFASANPEQMANVVAAGRITAETPATLAYNQLVAIAPSDGPRPLADLQDLSQPGLKVVLAAAEVPVGAYTLLFLDKATADPEFGPEFKAGVLANVVSYETNVKAIANKIALGEADAGIVYASDVTAANRDRLVTLPIPTELNVLANYQIAILKDSRAPELAARWLAYLLSPDGQAVLADNGLLPLDAVISQ
ncbi:MAG: molybdate ABC transporter substrate-binding protein [Anaerolineales bacterium]